MIQFTIPYPPTKAGKSEFCKRFSLNAYYSGKHWAQRRKDAEELHTLTVTCMKRAGIRRRILKSPVCISFWWDDRMDIDNHALIAKAVVDAMKGYILEDDNRQHFQAVCHQFWGKGCIGVQVEEIDL